MYVDGNDPVESENGKTEEKENRKMGEEDVEVMP